jgi:hypothetical protein
MCSDFMFDEAEFESLRRGWEDLGLRVDDVGRRFDGLDEIMSRLPAEDVATEGFQKRARHAMEAARSSNAALWDYSRAYLSLLEATKKAYATKDDGNAEAIDGVAS